MSLNRMLFETPWWLPTVAVVIGLCALVAGSRRQEKRILYVGIVLALLGVALGVISYLVETDRERAVRRTKELVAAVNQRDWAAFQARLDPVTSVYGIRGPQAITAVAKAAAERFSVRDARITGLEVEQADTMIRVTMRVLSEQSFGPAVSDWELQYQDLGQGWMLYNVRAMSSINFVTCHDGFTLNDLVCYERKHNQANGEDNRDGMNDNRSWNCGVEGPTDDAAVEGLRNRQVKNLLTATLLSIGVPMFVMGDEVRRTQHGNNNAYCHDDQTSWFDWSLIARHAGMLRFVRLLIGRRLMRSLEHERRRMSLNELILQARKAWHGVRLNQPDWADHSHSIAFTVELGGEDLLVHLILNAYWEPLTFELPAGPEGVPLTWRRWIDTALDAPDDIVPWESASPLPNRTYTAEARSVAVLIADSRWNLQGRPHEP